MNIKDVVLDDLVKGFELQTKLANEDLSGWDKRTLNGKITAKRAAADAAAILKAEYNHQLACRSGTLFVYGKNGIPKEFYAACKEFNVPVYTTDLLYNRLSEPVERNLGNRREFNAHSVSMLVSEMAVVGKELGLEYIQSPKLTGVTICEKATDTLDYVRKIVRNSETGDSLAKSYLMANIFKDSLAAGFNKPTFAVAVVCGNKEEAEGLSKNFLSDNNLVVDLADVTVTNGFVSGLIQKVKKTVKVAIGE